MANNQTVLEFQGKLIHLNRQLIKINSKITEKSEELICYNHKKSVESLSKYQTELTLMTKKSNSQQTQLEKKFNHPFINPLSPIVGKHLVK